MYEVEPEISICVPTFNRSQHLNYLLQHLFEQKDIVDFEYKILISNNASSDNTNEIAEEWSTKLPIKYFEQEKNIGASANLFFLFEQAVSEYSVYVADDDCIDLNKLKYCLRQAQSMPSVGMICTPWKIAIPNEIGGTQFYKHPDDILIQKGNFPELLSTILKYHIFPEIFVLKTELFKELKPLGKQNIIHEFFSIISEYVYKSDVLFSTTVFYTSISKHPAGSRIQAGHEQATYMWDSYRGGLELLLGHSIKLIEQDKLINYKESINAFIAIRMSVAIRLRLQSKLDKIETYFLACRLRGLGFEKLLPIPFIQIAISAAFEYIVQSTDRKKYSTILLLGDFEKSIIPILYDEFKFKDIKILSKIPKNQKNSIIFYRSEKLINGIKNNSVDAKGNHYFSEYILMNVKFR